MIYLSLSLYIYMAEVEEAKERGQDTANVHYFGRAGGSPGGGKEAYIKVPLHCYDYYDS